MRRLLFLMVIAALLAGCSGPSDDNGDAGHSEQATGENSKPGIVADSSLRDDAVAAISDVEDRVYGLADSAAAAEKDAPASLCADFLAEYTAWSDRFLKAAADMMEHPGDPASRDRYRQVASKVRDWNSRWEELQDCPQHPDFRRQFEALGRKMEQEIAKLQAE